MSANKQYSFDPGAMVIVQMGEELIGHPSTAIGELVKNGYDADATKCYVYIHTDEDPHKTFLVILDTGLGMDANTLFGDWLRPSISSKRAPDEKDRKSKFFERNFLGSKGIGRLAAMALGRYVTVISKTSDDREYNWLKTDREAFKSNLAVSEVTFPGGQIAQNPSTLFSAPAPFSEKRPNPVVNQELVEFLQHPRFNKFTEGTMIVIEEVDESIRTIMDNERRNYDLTSEDTTLVRSLRELITPLELNNLVQNDLIKLGVIDKSISIAKAQSTFDVFYGTNDYLVESKEAPFVRVDPVSILHKYDYRVIGKVEADASVVGYYFCQRLGEHPQIEEPFDLPSSYVLQEVSKDFTRRKRDTVPEELIDAKTGSFFFDIRVYDREEDVLEKLGGALNFSGTTAFVRKSARQTLDRYLGFRISKNGFGVKPYGDEQKDWLGINMLRVQDPAVIGINQILGNAFLYSPQNNGLSEKTNREGFFENKAFIVFKKILLGILSDFGQRRYNYRLHHNIGRITPVLGNQRPNPNLFLQFMEDNTSDEKILEQTKKFVEDTTTAIENIQSSLTFSQKLASLGQGLELVYHELSQPLSVMGGNRRTIERSAKNLADKVIAQKFIEEAASIKTSLGVLDSLKESLRPAIGISEPKEFKPYETFNRICHLFNKDIKRLDIKLSHDPALDNYTIIASEYVMWISFLNIINNAVYWLGHTESKRQIIFSLEDGAMTITNSSQKIPEDRLDDIFKYGVTMKKDKNATGLGLSFTKSLLDTNGWGISAANTKVGPAFSIKKKEDNA
jgi:signal transduction histidine kinase